MKRDRSPPNSVPICHLEPVSLRRAEAASLLHHCLTSARGPAETSSLAPVHLTKTPPPPPQRKGLGGEGRGAAMHSGQVKGWGGRWLEGPQVWARGGGAGGTAPIPPQLSAQHVCAPWGCLQKLHGRQESERDGGSERGGKEKK